MLQNKTQIILVSVFSALTVYLYSYLFTENAIVQLEIDSNVDTTFQIFWAEVNQPYAENRSSSFSIHPIRKKYLLSIPDLGKLDKLRIDPSKWWRGKSPEILIKKMTFYQEGYSPIRFSTEAEFRQLIPIYDIQRLEIQPEGLLVISSGNDPQLELTLKVMEKKNRFLQWIRCLLIIAGWILFFSLIPRLTENFDYICYLMVFVAALILIMAMISKMDSHPDEYVHLAAASYFQDHWLPPEVCAPGTEHTYSSYGISRLNSSEIVYLLAGKFSKLFSFIPLPEFMRLRLFNCVLFIILLFLGILKVSYRPVFIPVLIAPQVWYIFSYFNSDAFALFIIFIIGYIIINNDGHFQHFLETQLVKAQPIYYILYGLLFSFLLFIKINYYSFILFLVFYFIWRIYCKTLANSLAVKIKLSVIILLAGLFYLSGYLTLSAINDFNKQEKILECREKHAIATFKPSVKLKESHPWVRLKDKGISLISFIKDYKWLKRVFGNFFGTYHYTTIIAPKVYYSIAEIVSLFFILFIVLSIFLFSGTNEKLLLGIVFTCSFALIGVMAWRSWVVNLQAQGRYIFPILAMFGILLIHVEKYLNKTVLSTLTIIMFILSSYSFIFVGLAYIPKY